MRGASQSRALRARMRTSSTLGAPHVLRVRTGVNLSGTCGSYPPSRPLRRGFVVCWSDDDRNIAVSPLFNNSQVPHPAGAKTRQGAVSPYSSSTSKAQRRQQKKGGDDRPARNNKQGHGTPINRPPAYENRTTSRGVRPPFDLAQENRQPFPVLSRAASMAPQQSAPPPCSRGNAAPTAPRS